MGEQGKNCLPKKEKIYIVVLLVILLLGFIFHFNLQMKRRTVRVRTKYESIGRKSGGNSKRRKKFRKYSKNYTNK